MIEKIIKTNLADTAYEKIKASILSGQLKEGDKIPSENKLTKSLGISRVVVRDALQKLRNEHIIVTQQGKGSFIANPQNFAYESEKCSSLSLKEFSDIMEFRACIEASAIKRATLQASDEELKGIFDFAKKMKDFVGDSIEFTSFDYDFHLEIIKASHNLKLLEVTEQNRESIYKCLEIMNRLNDSREWGSDLHVEIAKHMVNRHSKAAIDAVKRNVEYNIARIGNILS